MYSKYIRNLEERALVKVRKSVNYPHKRKIFTENQIKKKNKPKNLPQPSPPPIPTTRVGTPNVLGRVEFGTRI